MGYGQIIEGVAPYALLLRLPGAAFLTAWGASLAAKEREICPDQ